MLLELLKLIHEIQSSRKGGIGWPDNTYLPQLSRERVDELERELVAFLASRSNIQEDVLELLRKERARQDAKWGADREQNDKIWLTILAEEFGEAAKAILERNPDAMSMELSHVAAVAVAWLENIVRRAQNASAERN
jgi:NTP pyrophosphatase (non-canonical NTP hydrolase)